MKKFFAIIVSLILALAIAASAVTVKVATVSDNTANEGIDVISITNETCSCTVLISNALYARYSAWHAKRIATRHQRMMRRIRRSVRLRKAACIAKIVLLLPLIPLFGIGIASSDGEQHVRKGGRVERARQLKAEQEAAELSAQNALRAGMSNAARAVAKRAEQYAANDNQVKTEIKQRLAEGKAEEFLQGFEEPRPVGKCEPAKIAGFKHLTVPTIAIFPEISKLIGEINDVSRLDPCAVHLMRDKLQRLHKMATDEALKSEPIVVNKTLCHMDSGRQSMATDIAGVIYGEFSNVLLKTDAPIYNSIRPNRKVLKSAFQDSEKVVDEISMALKVALTCRGVKVDEFTYDAWAASASMQKEGKCWFGESKMMKLTADARHLVAIAAMGATTGADELKRQATLFSPSAVLYDDDDNQVFIRQIGIMKDIKTTELIPNALIIKDDGTYKKVKNYIHDVTKADGGMYFWSKIKSHQGRFYTGKYNGVNVSSLMKLLKLPEGIECIDGYHKLSELVGVATESVWKGKGLGISYAEFLNLLDKLAVKYPGINCLRVMRYADQADERQRHTSRQLVQQFITATDEMLHTWMKGVARKLLRNTTVSGVIVRLAGLDKPEEERTAMNKLFAILPELAVSKQYEQLTREDWETDFANNASGRINCAGQYPYITEDPLAVLQVLLEGRDPSDTDLGLLNPGEVSLPGVGHGTRVMSVRYPANFLTADVYTNVTECCNIYDSIGNVGILPFHGLYLIVNDGDVDGDEALFAFNKIIIEIVEKLHRDLDIPVVIFDHSSNNEKQHVETEADLCKLIARSLFTAEKYSRVGIYSNLAARCLTMAGDAWYRGDKDGMEHWLINAAFANVGTILCIDMVKTGMVPVNLINKLDKIADECSSKMPHNQRYAKHNAEQPYWDCSWDDCVMPVTNAVVDRLHDVLADYLKDYVDPESGEVMFRMDKEGLEFDVDKLLCHNPRVFRGYAPAGKLSKETVDKIGLYNWTAKEYKIELEDGKFSPKEIMKYFWENEAAIRYRSFNDEMSGLEADEQRTLLREYCRSVLLEIYRTDACDYNNLSDELKVKSVSNWFIRDAFKALLNADGTKKARKEALTYEDRHREASYARFVVEVFAEDILDNVKTNLLNPEKEQQMVRNVVMVQLDETGRSETLYTYITEERMYNGQMVVCPTPKGDKVCKVIHSGTRTVEALEAYRQQQHFDAYKVAKPYAC